MQAPTLDLNGDATVTTNGQYADNFNNSALNNSTGTTTWATSWAETGDNGGTNSATAGQITIDNGANVMRFGDNDTDAGNGTATIQRTVNLAGVTSATVSYSYNENSFDDNVGTANDELVTVTFSDDGTFSAGHIQTIKTINGASGSGNITNVPLTGTFTANAAIRFVVSGTNNNSATDAVSIDNLSIATTTTTVVPGTPGNNYETTYNENAPGVAIAAGALITDDGTTIASSRVVLTNASAGDVLSVAGLPGGIGSSIDTSVPGQITLNLTGTSSLANYRTAIQQVRYSNSSENPNPADRILQVSVNDGLLNSNIATATVHVVPTNDAPVANTDTVITNVANGANFSIAVSALLANDTDPEGSPVTITAVNTPNGLNAPTLGATAVTVSDTGVAAGGSFNYVASDGTLSDPTTTVNVSQVATGGTINGGVTNEIIVGDGSGGNIVTGVGNINGGGGNDHIDAGDGNDVISGGAGNDIVLGGTGNDTITLNATDGFDVIDGGAGTDTFQLNGNGDTETFRIYARAAAIAAGVAVQGALTEIVITRTVTTGLTTTTTVIAELDNIEEITVNTLNTTANNGNNPNTPDGGISNGDTIQVIGNFNAPFTSLNFNTITIDGNAGDDTIDISSLGSAHRIVFRSNGGNDTIIGNLRPQDVIELPQARRPQDFTTTTNADGVSTMTNGTHSITFTAPDGMPQIGR